MSSKVKKTVKLSSQNQITIPASLREAAGVGPGDRMEANFVDGNIVLSPPPSLADRVEAQRARLARFGPPARDMPSDEELRAQWDR